MKINVILKSIMFLAKKKGTAKHTLKENPIHNYLQMYYIWQQYLILLKNNEAS